eukprot:TRINITY_DN12954_c0_g1_i1.p1 TRINITY_DN12954_c0_g1~~TRINITY_DN12954_c0_g1_i1.p1  ORF type:complete len:257 (+),score=47.81 TRINITY_DN12954_c0_g1_i1:85-771(+)
MSIRLARFTSTRLSLLGRCFCSSGTAGAEPAYVTRQREALRQLQQFELESAAGKTGDDFMSNLPILVLGAAFTGVFGWVGYSMWDSSTRSTKMKEFLEEKEKEEGVIKLPSGLLYKILKHGEGAHHPTARSSCIVNYRGTLTDGTEFDCTPTGKPATFAPYKLIRGWAEALQMMVEGDKWELYIPSDLAYGGEGSGKVPGSAALVFEMELVRIDGRRVPRKHQESPSS